MWECLITIPLWDEVGALPQTPGAVQALLGIDQALVDDLRIWALDVDFADRLDSTRSEATQAQMDEALDARAQRLVGRLRDQVGETYNIVYVPEAHT